MSMEEEHSQNLQIINDNKSDITSCDFGGNYLLAIGSSDKSVRILEWKRGLGFVDVRYSPLQCHKYAVTWVRFSPQGTMLASSSVDGTTVLWNMKTGMKIHTIVQPTKCSVRRCEFTPDSAKLLTAGDDGVFCFWDLFHGIKVSKHWLHNDEDSRVQGLSISPDSDYLLTGDSSGLLKLWSLTEINLNHLQPLHIVKNVHDGISCCEFSPNFDITGNGTLKYKYLFATCGGDTLIKLWALEVRRTSKEMTTNHRVSSDLHLVRVLEGHKQDVLNLRFSFNGALIGSAGLDKMVKMWQVETGTCINTFNGHTRFVNCCAFSKNSDLLASGSNDKSVIIWDLNRQFTLDSELVQKCNTSSHFSDNGSVRSFLAEEMLLHRSENDTARPECLQRLNLSSSVNAAHFHGNNLLATAGGDKSVTIWKREPRDSSFVIETVVEGHKYGINHVEISPCAMKMISCSMSEVILFWDLQMGLAYEMNSPKCRSGIRTNRFSPHSEFIAAAGDDQLVFLWNAKNLEFIKTLQEHEDAVTAVAFSYDSKLVASTCCAGDLKVYDLKTDKYFATKNCVHDLGANCCDFSSQVLGRDEYILATCGNDSLVMVWRVEMNNITEWRKLSGHGGNVNYVRFSPKKPALIVSCATDHTARLWNVESGECVHVFDHHKSIVTTCSFSHDSTLLVTGSLDKSVTIWSLPSDMDVSSKASFIKCSRKLIQNWSTSDTIEWLNELGFHEISSKVENTSLNGEQLLALKISEILDIIGIREKERKSLALHIYWARKEAKRNLVQSRLHNDVAHEFLCPITHEIMSDPVICSDGFTYERGAILEWLLCGRYTSPMTNDPLRDLNFLPNVTLKARICTYLYGDDIED